MVSTKNRSKWALPIVAIVFVLATILQLLTPTPVYADTESDIHDMNYKYYAARYLRDCLFNLDSRFKNSIAQNALNEGTWLYSGYKVNIGRYFERDDGVAGCDETSIVKTAMTSLGYGSDPGKLLTDIGYTKQGDSYIRPASGDTMNTTVVDKYQQRDYAKYAALQYIFNNDTSDRGKCELIEPPTGKSPAQITYKKVVKNDNGEWVVQDTKAEFQTEYLAKSNKVNYDYKAGALNSATCIDLRTEMDGLVNAVVTYNKQHQDDPITDGLLNGGQAECNKDSPTWNEESQTCSDDTPTCTDQIKGIGWLICPTMEFLAEVNDYAYGFLASNFLQTDTSLVKGAEAPWARFKDLANIAFVIALLFVIYSQITSVGISNYGIKKMLPKIIVAALLVNLSYIICQVAVDLSNILGYGISKFFTGIPIGSGVDTTSDEGMKALGLTLNWTGAVGAILVAGVGLAMALSFPVVLSALLAIAMIALILIARKALIVLLIVVAPLAFVAYLLPNTEQWFKKWLKLFSTLLLLFPIVGVVFGASALAAKIVATAAGAANDTLMQLTALAISALPFFVVPGLLKGALNAAGAFGAKMQGWANGASKRMSSGASKKASERWGNTGIARGLAAGKAARASARTARYARRINDGGPGSWGARAGAFMGGGAGGVDKLNQSAQAQADKDFEEDVKAVTSSFDPSKHDEIINMAKTGQGAKSDAERVAAIRYAAQKGGAGDVGAINSKGQSGRVRNAHVDAIKEKKLNNVIGNKALSEIAGKGMDGAEFDDKVVKAANDGIISGGTLVQSDSTPKLIADAVGRNAARGGSAVTLDAGGRQNLQDASDDARSAPGTKTSMTKQMEKDLNSMGVTTP